MPKQMQDKVCVITGGAGSIGTASAKLLLQEGAKVMITDLHEAALQKAAAAIGDKAGADRLAWCAADVTKSDQVKNAIARTVSRFGKIDVLFSNAGNFGGVAPIADYPEEAFDSVLAVHVKGAFLCAKHAVPQMNDGGSIVITSSVAGVTGDPGVYGYITAKHAQVGLMRVLAKELAGRNIRVNTRRHAVFQRDHPAASSRPRRGGGPFGAFSRFRCVELHHRQPVDGGRRHERVTLINES
jgi:NAD(P)-dependent dehydrogenase (short-subunit alcohol dehydrogenase family)